MRRFRAAQLEQGACTEGIRANDRVGGGPRVGIEGGRFVDERGDGGLGRQGVERRDADFAGSGFDGDFTGRFLGRASRA